MLSWLFIRVVPCEAILNETASCSILETELVFFLKGNLDPDVAAFASYAAIEDHMALDKYIGAVPSVLLLEYLSPSPLTPPPPPNSENGTDTDNGTDGNDSGPAVLSSTASADRLEVSPWTIGACVATIMGGVISLLVYSRNRQARQRGQLQLVDGHHSSAVLERRARNPITI